MLPLQQAYGILTSLYTEAYREMIPVSSFLKSFFPSKTTRKATVKLEVQRGTERIAVDVLRGSRGNRNTFSLWSQKEYLPPFYKEYFDATQLDNYDRVFGEKPDVSDAEVLGRMAKDIATNYNEIRNKIERRKELQCAQVFDTGVVTMENGDNIDFKRKATSMVDLAATGGYWSTVTATVEAQLIASAEFLRRTGKNGVPTLNLVMPGTAWVYLKKTNYFKDVANFRNVQLIDIKTPQSEAFGASFHGQLIAGAYIFNVWTYDEIYEDSTDTVNRYWPATKAFVIPTTGTRFTLQHAGLPKVMKAPANMEFKEAIARVAATYVRYNLIDANASAHYFYLMSACVAMPTTIDQIYTMQVLGAGGGQG